MTSNIRLRIIPTTSDTVSMFESLSLYNSYLLQIHLALLVTLQPLHRLPQLFFSRLPPVIRIDLFPLILRRRTVFNHGLTIEPAEVDSLVSILLLARRGISFITGRGLTTFFNIEGGFFVRGFWEFNQFLSCIGFQLEVPLSHWDHLS